MSRVAHVVARAVADDPHTLGVLGLADALHARAADESPSVFAAVGADAVEGVAVFGSLPADDSTPVVYHLAGAAPALVARLAARRGPVIVADGGAPLDPLARLDLKELAAAGASALATRVTAATGSRKPASARCRWFRPWWRARDCAVPVFEPTANHLAVTVPGPLLVSIDDLVTGASSTRVVHAFHVLRTYLVRAGHLAVGVVDSPDTSAAAVQTLYREVWGLRLTDAWAQHLVTVGERAALTRRAELFVSSDPAVGDMRHALAAMAEGTPVVAPADPDAAAVLADGALTLPVDAGAPLIAEALASLLTDDALRSRFAAAAARVAAQYEPAIVAPEWRKAIES